MQTSFRSVMMSDHCDTLPGSSFSSFNNDYDDRNIDADNVAILGGGTTPKDTHHEPMSAARQCCFVGSIALCVLVVFGFICLVPCREDGTCPAVVDRIKSHNWLNNYTRIELKGGVHIVSGHRSWENNLIFLYRGDMFFPEFEPSKTKRNGIISLIGSSGAVAWLVEMVDEPLAIDCSLLDADRNGRMDCLVLDEYGEIGVINPLIGQWIWRYKEHAVQKLHDVDFPVVLPDLDGDGVLEVLTVSSASLQQRTKAYMNKGTVAVSEGNGRNMLRILSGRTGHAIGHPFEIHDCYALRKLQLENQRITFNCVRNNTELQRFKTLGELFALITNKSLGNQKLNQKATERVAQHCRGQTTKRNVYSLSGREMLVENHGHCPDSCSVTFQLRYTDAMGETKMLRNFTKAGMYGMVPAQWHFKNTKMSGFVMKFWKWHNSHTMPDTDDGEVPFSTEMPVRTAAAPSSTPTSLPAASTSTSTARTDSQTPTTSANGRKIKSNQISKENFTKPNQLASDKNRKDMPIHNPVTEFNAFDPYVQKRNTYTVLDGHSHRFSRSPDGNLTKKPSTVNANHLISNYKMQMITETVILILFIGGDTRIENTSQSNIVQFCRKERNEMVCQPDLRNQDNSMLIVDLDQDDSQELVSYSSTFVEGPGGVSADEPDNWNLVTYVRLLRLQSELPAFYSDDTKPN